MKILQEQKYYLFTNFLKYVTFKATKNSIFEGGNIDEGFERKHASQIIDQQNET